MKKLVFSLTALALVSGLAACAPESAQSGAVQSSAAQSAGVQSGAAGSLECPTLPADAPQVNRSGEGVFPEVTGEFGQAPQITPPTGAEPTEIHAKTLIQGDGPVVCADDQLEVHYAGVLWDGTEFDSSFSRGEPTSFSLNGVIQGWKYGLAGQRVGDRVVLTIPSEYAYGAQATGNIPPNSTLIFVVDIIASVNVADTSLLKTAKATDAKLPEGIEVSGEIGAEPKVTFAAGSKPEPNQFIVLAEGTGPKISDTDQVIVRVVGVEQGATQSESRWNEPVLMPAGTVEIAGFTAGSRLLTVRTDPSGQAKSMAFIVDIAGVIPAK